MMLAVFAGPWQMWSFGDWSIVVVAIAAIVALVCVALNKFGITIPDWVKQIFWIVVVAFVVIGAIRAAEAAQRDKDATPDEHEMNKNRAYAAGYCAGEIRNQTEAKCVTVS